MCIYIYIYVLSLSLSLYIYIYIYIYIKRDIYNEVNTNNTDNNNTSTNNDNNNDDNGLWLWANGVNTNEAAAKVMSFDRFGRKGRPGTFGKIKVG